jgi:NADPH:quinone reductase-like Zn-dependent oxidoreductase
MARAWVIPDSSGYESLTLEELEPEDAGPGEIRLRVEAFALNWGDMDLMRGNYSFSFPRFPARIGIEAAGIVDQVGPDVTGIELGDRYCTLPYFYYNRGASTESMLIDARYVTKAPDGLSAVESASIWMQYMTAYFPVVERSNAGPGSSILVTAATGTAGTAALEIGRLCGANMIGTTRFERNRSFLEEVGADHVYIVESGDLGDALREMTDGKGIDAAFDCIGAGMIHQYSPALARDARIYFYGFLDAQFPELPLIDIFQANTTFHPYSLFNYVENPELCAKGKAFVYDAIAEGKIAARIDRVYPMEGYREAWDYLKEPRDSHGKVVVETGV